MLPIIKRLTNLLLLVIFFFTMASAQDINLTGRVVDKNGIPVSGAQLRLKSLHYAASTTTEGIFTIDKSMTGTAPSVLLPQTSRPGFTPQFLFLGSSTTATVTIFSIHGAMLNRMAVTNCSRIAISTLIPRSIHSQALIISIVSGTGTVNLRTVRCGSQWLINHQQLLSTSSFASTSAAAVPTVDTIIVAHDKMRTAIVPVTSLVATLPDIVLQYIVDPVPPKGKATLIGDIAITPPSTTFSVDIAVTLSTILPSAEIRYTTDGTLPTATSTLYGGALTLTETTQLRAAAFITGTSAGEPSTALFVARALEYTSDIPILVIEGYGAAAPEDKYTFIEMGIMTFEPVDGIASLANPPSLATRAGYHLRGQSSMMMFAQAPYRIELWDNNNNDADYPLLGMSADADWALISPCTDNTLIRSVFVYDLGKSMGLKTVEWRFVEVFINQDGGPLEMSDYEGIYAIMQPIKNRKSILDLKQLRPEDTDPAKLSGGYIFKFDQMVNDSGMIKLECVGADKMTGMGFVRPRDSLANTANCFADLELVSPSSPNQEQIDWITTYIQEFHDALHAEPVGNWKDYIDLNSFVNLHIVNEVSRDVDGWIRSHFMHKERGQPITAGPLWDYNFTLGNYSTDLDGWHCLENRRGSNDWHLRMWDQPEFKAAVKQRYTELRQTILADSTITRLIDDVRRPITNVAERNFNKWPMGECSKDSNMMFLRPAEVTDSTWMGQITALKTWTTARLRSLDSSMTTLP